MSGGAISSVFIVNKDGSLLYNQDFGGGAQLSANDKIRLSSTFHGMSAIASQVSPCPKGAGTFGAHLQATGITVLEADTFRVQCFQTLTGMKFIGVVPNPKRDVEEVLKQIYALFTDYVLKNPFYNLDMPVHCDLFAQKVAQLVGEPVTVTK
mmetsp:Transcript_20342/g.54363  ORF Transcript_20342/g.54363 Transcript_20342/m.54363 type:complete len:152 (-) Transcript_20342:71-526(-)